jgi:hypothetical protein
MKKFTLIFMTALAVTFSGCISKTAMKAVKDLKDDPATVNMGYRGIYGSFWFTRTNPKTNHTAVVGQDGTVSVGVDTNKR